MRYAISLTSIPPRLPRLGPVLRSLLAQRPAPERVILCLPRSFRRFPGPVSLPDLPEGVVPWPVEEDWGPATKALAAARALSGQDMALIYCDDDWIYPQGWAQRLLAAQDAAHAAAATGFSVARLKRESAARAGCFDIAQGYSGVCVRPEWFAGEEALPPPAAWAVDDIWLSGQLARQGVAIRAVPEARAGLRPAYDDAHGLQDARIAGVDRHAANMACLDLLTDRYGIWAPCT
jgi:hypothetical protein